MSTFPVIMLAELSATSFWGGIAVGLILAVAAQILVRVLLPVPGFKTTGGTVKAAEASQAVPARPQAQAGAPGEITPEILTVITSAVHVALAGRPHKIHAITPTVGMASVTLNQQAWSMEGRRQIFQSHRIR